MNNRSLLLLFIMVVLLNGCSKSSIDAKKKDFVSSRTDNSSMSQLTDQDVFGNELTLEISEEDIQNAVEEAQGPFELPLNSAIVLVQSGARAPDVMMQNEMQRYYQVSTFSGIPVLRKKYPIKAKTPEKEIVDSADMTENDAPGENGVVNTNYMQALRYIAAKGRNKTVVVYWDNLEIGQYNSATKEVVWRKYNGEKLSGSSLRYLIRFALVDVDTGEWATYSPVNTETTITVPLTAKATAKTTGKMDTTEQEILTLKQKTYQMVVSDLVKRYSNKL